MDSGYCCYWNCCRRQLLADPIYRAATTGAQGAARNVTAAALEPAGEFAGEFLGQGIATGEFDTKEAFLEAASSIGQSGMTFAGQKAYQAMKYPFKAGKDGNTPAGAPPDSPSAGDILGTPEQSSPAAENTVSGVTASAQQADQPTEAEKALYTPKSLTALDRVNEIDAKLSAPDITPEVANPLITERDSITASWPKAMPGATTSFTTEAGARLDGQYALIEAGDLTTSHDENLRPVATYPAELQPRERERHASEMQIQQIVGRLDPARLGESADVATGAPIVGADGLVESGNARTIALKRVYQANGQKAIDYKTFLKDNADRFGITPESVDAMQKPVLVRVRTTPVNRVEFARQANASTVARMSPGEQAKSDAAQIDSLDDLNPDESGDFMSGTSRPFVRRFLSKLAGTEQAGLIDATGQLSQAGYTRIRNAVLAKAYGDSPVLLRMVESLDDNTRNVSKALLRVAPQVAKAREAISDGALHDVDLTPDLMAAVEKLSDLKEKGVSVEQALAQAVMFGDKLTPEARELLGFLDANIRSPRRIAEFVQNYIDALGAAGNPNQGSLLGDATAPAKGDLLAAAKRGQDGIAEDGGQPEAVARTGEESGQQPKNAPGDSRSAQGDEAARRELIEKQWSESLGDLGAIVRDYAHVARMVPEDAPNLMPTLVKLFEAGFGKVGYAAKDLIAYIKAELKKLPEFKSTWNKIAPETYRKAAASALANHQAAPQQDLFAPAVEKAMQGDLFSAPARDKSAVVMTNQEKVGAGGTAEDDGATGLRIANDLAAQWQKALGDKVKVVMGGSLISGTFVQTGNDPIDMDVRFLSDDPEAAIPDIERVTGLKFRKTIAASDFPVGTSTAYMIEGFLNVDGKTIEVEGSARNKAYVGWANYYKQVFSEQELADFRKDKLALKGDKKAYKARKNAMLQEAQTRAILRGLIKDADYPIPAAWKKADNGKGYIDKRGNFRAMDLNSRERFAEQQFYDWIHQDQAAAIEAYLSADPSNVDADKAKDHSALYRGNAGFANAVHEPSSYLAKMVWPEALKRDKRDNVIFTAGGAGSGKSFSGKLARDLAGLPGDTLTFDSSLTNFEEAVKRVDVAIADGRKVHIIYTNTPVDVAFLNSFHGRDRLMQASVVASGHYRAAETLRKLSKHYQGNEGVAITVINSNGKGTVNVGSIEDIPRYDYNEIERRLHEIASQEHESGRLIASKFRFISGASRSPLDEGRGTVDGSRGVGARDNAGGREVPQRTLGSGPDGSGTRIPGGINERHGKDGSGSTQGQVSVASRGTGRKRTTQRIREGEGGNDLFADNEPGTPNGEPVRVRQDGRSDGARENNERRAATGQGDRAGRATGIPAGRDIPAKSGRNYRFSDGDLTYEGGWQKKAAQNVEAVELAKKLETEGRQATREEQAVLAKFIGWGASEIRNSIFGDKLDKAARSINDWKDAKAAMDEAGGSLDAYHRSYYPAYILASHADPSIRYRVTITAAMLDKAKPDMSAAKWIDLRDRLKAALTEEEWATAERSTQYAHYTSKAVVQSMWKAVERMGFKGGAILEPGAGIGVFPGLMDSALATNSAYTGIEYDALTGAILKRLFPDERILVESFVDSSLPDNFYDMAIGNPPFANVKILSDPKYKKHAFSLHDYFFAKSIDKVKPGGLMVYVTSRYTMDKQGDKARKYLADRADLIGAIRLPQTAFQKNAGTEVVTDVLFLRKRVTGDVVEKGATNDRMYLRDGAGNRLMEVSPWLGVQEVQTDKGPALINEYFAAHPEMVLGAHSLAGSMYSKNEYTVLPNKDSDIEAQFAAAIENLPADIYRPTGAAAEAAKVREIDFNPKAQKEGNYYLSDAGVLMQREGGVGVRADEGKSEKTVSMLKDFVKLRDALKQAHYDQLNDGDWAASLKALQKEYRAFVMRHGNILQNRAFERTVKREDEETGQVIEDVMVTRRFDLLNKINDDPDYTLVEALEKLNEETGEIAESAFLRERVLAKPSESRIETPHDALLSVLNDTGAVDLPLIAERLGLSETEAAAALGTAIYESPSEGWQMSDAYLSGNVKQKLAEAHEATKSDRRFERNVEALLSAQPAPVPPSDITAAIGMNWVPANVYAQFLQEKTGVRATVDYNERTGQWAVTAHAGWQTPAATVDWGTVDRNAADILDHALTGRPIRVTRTEGNGSDRKQVFDPAATEAANQKLAQMRGAFAEWLWQDGERADTLTRAYNDKFNTIVARKFDGRHLTLPGSTTTIKVFDHVKRGAWRIIQAGNTYLAHAVGSGKTWQMVISAMEQKRLGLIQKPMMVVPNHMLQQFAREWLQLYPAARLMVADEKQFHTENRRRFVARVAMSDLDGVIITHSAFKLLDLDPEFKRGMIEEQLDYLRAALEEAGGEEGKKSRDPKVRDIQNRIEKMEQKLEAAMSSSGKDKNVRFDQLGVDQLYVDEAHEFRKLAFTTQHQVKGIDSSGSDRAFDLWMKTRWLEQKKPGRSLVMASGTPVTNTLAELYSVQKFMAPQVLEDRGLQDFDSWAAMFGQENTEIEADASGKYAPVTRFTKFVNVPELTQMFREYADVLTSDHLAEMLGDKRPKVKDGSRKLNITPQTDDYTAYKAELASRLEASRRWKPSKDEPNNPDPIIKIIGDGRLAAIDMRFVDPSLPSDPDSKLNQMIDGVIEVFKRTAGNEYVGKDGKPESAKGGAQMVFSDLGFGSGVAANRGFNARSWFEKRLRDAGIPMNQVAFMSDHKKSSAKLKLFQDVNAGRVRILVGSSKNMGTGVNAQQRLVALHHLDTPWYPADLEQREGRIIRQGNKNPLVEIYAYSTKGSYDTVMWQMLASKQRFIDQALSGDSSVRSIDDLTEASQFQIATAMTAGDPRAIQLAGLKADIDKYHRLYRAHEESRSRLRREYDLAGSWIEAAERQTPDAEKQAARVQSLSGENFTAKADGKAFDKRKEWGEALLATLKDYAARGKDGRLKAGEISGFPVEFVGQIVRDAAGNIKEYRTGLWMQVGEDSYTLAHDPSEDPVGMAMRATNILASISRKPAELRQRIDDSKAKRAALVDRLDAKFQFAGELADKLKEAEALEAAMVADQGKVDEPKADEPKLSRGAGRGMSLRDLQAVVDRLTPGFKNLPRVHVMESPADLSTKDPSQKALRDYIKSRDAMDDADGAMHDGEIYLFASGMAGELRAEHVLATHEITHYGLRGAIGKELDAALQHVWLHNGKVRKAAQELRRADETIKSNVEAVEEVLADLPSADLAKLTGWRKVVQVVRNWLNKAGAKNLAARLDKWLNAGLSEQQQADLFVADLVNAARDWVRTGKGGNAGVASMGGTRLAEMIAEDSIAEGFVDGVRKVIAESIAGRRLPSAPMPVMAHAPTTLQTVGWDDLPVSMNPKEIDKVHFDHGMTADRIAKLVPETLENPSLMLLSATVPGRVVLVARESGNKPVLLVVSPEVDVHREGAAQRKEHLIVSMYPKDEGWDWVARQIRNGNLLYRDPESDAAGKVKGAIADAQKKFAQTGRKLMGLIPKRGAELLGDGYKVLLPSDLRKMDGAPRLSRAVPPAPGSAASPTPLARIKQWKAIANSAIERMDNAINGMGEMPDQARYLAERYRTLGRIAHIDEIAKLIGDAFRSVGLADKNAIYDYLTTRGANPNKISDKNAREWAVKAKTYIGTVGDELVNRGLIPQESREEYRDRYLPRLYLAHLLDDASWRAIGGGKKASDMGYLKQRNDDLPEEYRKVILGEVTDPAFLAASAIAQPMRDMAILDWLGKIVGNENWVWPKQLIEWGGRQVSAHWLQAEADSLLKRSALYENDADRKKAEAIASEMRKKALAAMADMPREHADYKRIPDTPRYGQLRGLLVRREIYDDLVGLGTGVPGDAGFAEQLLGQGGLGSKATQLWKTAKVALNPPGQIRNFISNAVMLQLSGVPLRKIPGLIVRAAKQIKYGGKHWQAAKKYGVTAATFTAQELYRSKRDLLDLEVQMKGIHPVIAVKIAASWVMDKAGDAYQFSEALMKTVKMIDAMEREGMTEEQAALEAHDWLLDYSLVNRNIRYLRNAPVGMPFLTYSAKVAPRLLEVAVNHPTRFLPWVALFYGMGYAAMAALGGSGDDWDELKKSLPEWLRKKPHAVPLPWRDSEGRIQFTDIGYFFPWSQWAELGKDLAHGEPLDALRSAGIIGGPVPDIITAIKTGIDPFTKKPIADPADPTWQQSVAVMNYAWNMAAPPFLTANGFLSPMGLFDKQYGGKLVQGVTGTTDKWGDPRATTEQAFIGLAGVNIKGVDPDHTRASELQRLQREALDVKSKLVRRLADRSLSETQRTILMSDYSKEMLERIKKAQEYGSTAKVPAFARPIGGADAR